MMATADKNIVKAEKFLRVSDAEEDSREKALWLSKAGEAFLRAKNFHRAADCFHEAANTTTYSDEKEKYRQLESVAILEEEGEKSEDKKKNATGEKEKRLGFGKIPFWKRRKSGKLRKSLLKETDEEEASKRTKITESRVSDEDEEKELPLLIAMVKEKRIKEAKARGEEVYEGTSTEDIANARVILNKNQKKLDRKLKSGARTFMDPRGGFWKNFAAGLGLDKLATNARSVRHAPRGHHSIYPAISQAVILGIIGILVGAFIGSLIISIAFGLWALSSILPGAMKVSINTGKVDEQGNKETAEIVKGKTSSVLKAMMQLMALVLGMYALYTSNLPLSALVMLFVGFAGYMALPVEIESGRPDMWFRSFTRMFLGVVVLSIWIFGNLFQSPTLMWMGILFLAVPPLKRGDMGDKIRASNDDMFYKIFFLLGMIFIFLSVQGWIGFTGWDLGQTGSLVFYLIWGMSFISGLFSATEDIPKIGSILLIVALILFGTTGSGGENIGIAMFGQWWPTVHNSIGNTLTPLGDMFSGLTNTFGSSYMMLTNPMGFATQIMDGGYSKNTEGLTGTYGLEINNLQADVIHPETPFTIRFELHNRGVKDAEIEKLIIMSTIGGITFTDEDEEPLELDVVSYEEDEKTKQGFFRYNYDMSDHSKIIRNDVVPVFIMGEVTCAGVEQFYFDYSNTDASKVGSFITGGKITGERLKDSPDALKYITVMVKERYKYATDSAIQLKFISNQAWEERSRQGNLIRTNELSTMTSGPVKLNLGTPEQPIKEDTSFYIGFNMSTDKPRTKILNSEVTLKLPFKVDLNTLRCSARWKDPDPAQQQDDKEETELTWIFGDTEDRSVFCYFDEASAELVGPERTLTIEANASYTVESWENYETRTSFSSVCYAKDQTDTVADNFKPDTTVKPVEDQLKLTPKGDYVFDITIPYFVRPDNALVNVNQEDFSLYDSGGEKINVDARLVDSDGSKRARTFKIRFNKVTIQGMDVDPITVNLEKKKFTVKGSVTDSDNGKTIDIENNFEVSPELNKIELVEAEHESESDEPSAPPETPEEEPETVEQEEKVTITEITRLRIGEPYPVLNGFTKLHTVKINYQPATGASASRGDMNLLLNAQITKIEAVKIPVTGSPINLNNKIRLYAPSQSMKEHSNSFNIQGSNAGIYTIELGLDQSAYDALEKGVYIIHLYFKVDADGRTIDKHLKGSFEKT